MRSTKRLPRDLVASNSYPPRQCLQSSFPTPTPFPTQGGTIVSFFGTFLGMVKVRCDLVYLSPLLPLPFVSIAKGKPNRSSHLLVETNYSDQPTESWPSLPAREKRLACTFEQR